MDCKKENVLAYKATLLCHLFISICRQLKAILKINSDTLLSASKNEAVTPDVGLQAPKVLNSTRASLPCRFSSYETHVLSLYAVFKIESASRDAPSFRLPFSLTTNPQRDDEMCERTKALLKFRHGIKFSYIPLMFSHSGCALNPDTLREAPSIRMAFVLGSTLSSSRKCLCRNSTEYV